MANLQTNEQLDRAGRLVLLAATGSEAEIEAAASSPFVLTRVRAAIAEEQRRREETTSWFSLIFVARRAVPAMVLITVLAAVMMLWSSPASPPNSDVRLGEEAMYDTRDTGVVQTIIANRSLSRDEVFGLVVDRSGQERR